jgi:hypothetical protein
MKKLLFLLFIIIMTDTINAQWELKYSLDEFGEKTSNSQKTLTAEGTFSNIATQNSEALFYFVDKGDAMLIYVYEYKSSLATDTESTFELVKVRKKGGDTSYLESVFFTEEGALFFNGRVYNQLKNIIKNSGDYIMIFERTSKYSNSKYKINFSIVNEDEEKEPKDDLVFNPEPFKIKLHNSFLNDIKATAKYSTKKAKEKNVEVEFYANSELKMFTMSFKNYDGTPPKSMKKSIFEKLKIQLPDNYSIDVNAFISDKGILINDKDYDKFVRALNDLGNYKIQLKSKKIKYSYTIEFKL